MRVTPKHQPWWVGPLFSLMAGIGGIVWGIDYIDKPDRGGVIISDSLLSVPGWGWGFLIHGLIVTTFTVVQLGFVKRARCVPRWVTVVLIVGHYFGVAVCCGASIATAIGVSQHGDGERVLFAAIGGAVNNLYRALTLPCDLFPPPRLPWRVKTSEA